MKPVAHVLIGALMLMHGLYAFADEALAPVLPSIGANYTPEPGTDEHEIWSSLEKVQQELERSPLVINDEAVNAYLKSILCRLDSEVCKDIRIYVVRNPNFNAMMYPNGIMVVWTGLLIRMRNEAQLAAVLGHEMGHYLRQHSLNTWRANKSAANTGLVISIVAAGAGYGAVGDLINLGIMAGLFKYSRENEEEADLFGVQRLSDAGYDPHAAADVWAYVALEEERAQYKERLPLIFRSHPVNDDRFRTLHHFANVLPMGGEMHDERYWQNMSTLYLQLVGDQLAMNKPGRTEAMLSEHEDYAIDPSLVSFAWGDFYRGHGSEEALVKAATYYEAALQSPDAPAAARRELGIIRMKQKDFAAAREHLGQYLVMQPAAEDAAIVEFYLSSIEGR